MFAERAFLSRSLRKDTGGGSFCKSSGGDCLFACWNRARVWNALRLACTEICNVREMD